MLPDFVCKFENHKPLKKTYMFVYLVKQIVCGEIPHNLSLRLFPLLLCFRLVCLFVFAFHFSNRGARSICTFVRLLHIEHRRKRLGPTLKLREIVSSAYKFCAKVSRSLCYGVLCFTNAVQRTGHVKL